MRIAACLAFAALVVVGCGSAGKAETTGTVGSSTAVKVPSELAKYGYTPNTCGVLEAAKIAANLRSAGYTVSVLLNKEKEDRFTAMIVAEPGIPGLKKRNTATIEVYCTKGQAQVAADKVKNLTDAGPDSYIGIATEVDGPALYYLVAFLDIKVSQFKPLQPIVHRLVTVGSPGSSGKGQAATSTATQSLTKSEFIAKADQVCSESRAGLDVAVRALSSVTVVTKIPSVVHQLAQVELAEVERLRAIGLPPGAATQYVDTLAQAASTLSRLGEVVGSLATSRSPRIRALQAEYGADVTKAQAIAHDYGFKVCGSS